MTEATRLRRETASKERMGRGSEWTRSSSPDQLPPIRYCLLTLQNIPKQSKELKTKLETCEPENMLPSSLSGQVFHAVGTNTVGRNVFLRNLEKQWLSRCGSLFCISITPSQSQVSLPSFSFPIGSLFFDTSQWTQKVQPVTHGHSRTPASRVEEWLVAVAS